MLTIIYKSRNFTKLLGVAKANASAEIYKSRNFTKLLGQLIKARLKFIYKSRNFTKLLGPAGGRSATTNLQE